MKARKKNETLRSAAYSAARKCSSGKLGYPTRATARSEASRLSRQFGHELSVYRCRECKLFHTTSRWADGLTTNGTPRRVA